MMQPHGDKKQKSRRILTEQQAIEIFKYASSHEEMVSSAISVARKYGVNERTVRDIWKQRTWTHATHPLEGSKRVQNKKKVGRPKGSKDIKPRKQKQGPLLISDFGRKALTSISHAVFKQFYPYSGVTPKIEDTACLRPNISVAERHLASSQKESEDLSLPFDEGPSATDFEFLSEKGSIDAELHSWTVKHLPWIERVESFLPEWAFDTPDASSFCGAGS
jgi:hypothetical protein